MVFKTIFLWILQQHMFLESLSIPISMIQKKSIKTIKIFFRHYVFAFMVHVCVPGFEALLSLDNSLMVQQNREKERDSLDNNKPQDISDTENREEETVDCVAKDESSFACLVNIIGWVDGGLG